MSRADRIALILALAGVLTAWLVAVRVFEEMAHIEDEMAYVWQAQAIARGALTVPSPASPESFLYPFVVDYGGRRFGKYPLGWPALLGIGVFFGARTWVNPLLAGLGIWLTYRLGKRIFGEVVGLIAAALTLTSPFFLMNSGSLLSHPLGLALSAAFVLFWLDAFCNNASGKPWLAAPAAGAVLGLLALTRPMTAAAVALPFAVHGALLFLRPKTGNGAARQVRWRLLLVLILTLALASLHFLWQYAVSGDPLLNPYTLWWPYDRVGFGPGVGRDPQGHTLYQAWINTRFSLQVGARDLFGWGTYSWIFLPFGLAAALSNRGKRLEGLLLSLLFPSLLVCYLAYWIGSHLFGPRYYYESLFSLAILSAAGVAWLAGWPAQAGAIFLEKCFARAALIDREKPSRQKARPLLMAVVLLALLTVNLRFYVPLRLGGMHGLYGVQRSHLEPFLTPEAQALVPALVVVHAQKQWIEYGTLLELSNPFLDTPFIFIYSRNPETDTLAISAFPERRVFHYYADEPFVFYTAPRPALQGD